MFSGMEDCTLSARIVAVHSLPGVRAGSALLRIGNSLLAVQDDAWSVVWIDLPQLTLTPHILQGDGAALAKPQKPDFEAAIYTDDGIVRLFGSGSTAQRNVMVEMTLASRQIRLCDMRDLYLVMAQALKLDGSLNIEAASVCDDRLRLFHRGAGLRPSGCVEFSLDVLHGARPQVLSTQYYQFGHLEGVALHITDVALMGCGRTAFLAAAEQTEDAIADGWVAGSVMGWIEDSAVSSQSALRWSRLLEADGQVSRRKAEGLVMDDDGQAAWLLTDPDAADRPAELCRVLLEGFTA